MAKISVIVPVYNVEAYIHRCIDSILFQTFSDFELILVDDGSPDQCGVICDEYAAADPRVTVIHQNNLGLSAARNTGIDYAMACDSEWITFIDSDDYVVENYLRVLLDAVQGHDVSVGARIMTTGEALPEYEYAAYTFSCFPPDTLFLKIRGNFTIVVGKLFRKHLFSSTRFPVGRIHEDMFITYKVLFQFDSIPFVSQPLYAHFKNPAGLTRSPWTPQRLDELDALEEQVAFFVERGYLTVAGTRFRSYVRRNLAAQERIRQNNDLNEKEKRNLSIRIAAQLRKMLRLYCGYHWLGGWSRRKKFWILFNACSPYTAVHALRRMKALLRK